MFSIMLVIRHIGRAPCPIGPKVLGNGTDPTMHGEFLCPLDPFYSVDRLSLDSSHSDSVLYRGLAYYYNDRPFDGFRF